MAQQQVNQTTRTSPSGSVTNSLPGQGGGGQEHTGQDDSLLPATGSRRVNPTIAASEQIDDNSIIANSLRKGQGNQGNFKGDEELGIYMAIPSTETPGKYVEFDNLSVDAAHELTGMYKKAYMSSPLSSSNTQGSFQNQASTFDKETDKTLQYGHSGTQGKSLAPDSEDGRKTSPIRGGKGEGINQQNRNSNEPADLSSL